MKKIYIIPVLALGIIAFGYILGLSAQETKSKEKIYVALEGEGSVVALDATDRTSAQAGSGGVGTLTVGEKFYDFGTISMADGNVSRSFAIKNTETAPVVIKKVYTSCMCTTASLITRDGKAGPFGMAGHAPIPEINKTIAPGEEATVEVTFNPAAHGPSGTGKIRRVVYVEQAGSDKPLELVFEANVTK